MRIVKKRIDEIIPADYNPRKISKENLERLKKSIKEFGLVDPLVWNERTNRLIGGHQRLKILMEEGVKEVEVSVVNLPEDKEKALNIALNNPNLQGEWEEEKLTELLKELEEKEISDLTGFEEQEINFEEILEEKQEILKPYRKTHILISFHPDKFQEIKEILEKLKNIEGLEYEQGSN